MKNSVLAVPVTLTNAEINVNTFAVSVTFSAPVDVENIVNSSIYIANADPWQNIAGRCDSMTPVGTGNMAFVIRFTPINPWTGGNIHLILDYDSGILDMDGDQIPRFNTVLNILDPLDPGVPTVIVSTAAEMYAAIRDAAEGDIIGAEAGDYYVTAKNNFINKHNVTLRSVSGDPADVRIHGTGFHKENGYFDTPYDDLIIISNQSSHITIYGITVMDSNCHGIKAQGEDNVSDITVDRCRFININERGLKGSFGYPVNNLICRNCYFENTLIPVESDHNPTYEGNYIGGVDMKSLKNSVFSNNTFVNIKGYSGGGRGAIYVSDIADNITCENNIVIGCDRGLCLGNAWLPPTSTYHIEGGMIRNNFITNPSAEAIEIGFTNDVSIINNTIYRTDGGRGIRDTGYDDPAGPVYSTNTFIENNLVNAAQVDAPNADMGTHNLIGYLTGYFVDAAAGDLRLTANATGAIGQGVLLTDAPTDIDGTERHSPTDIGAYEFPR